MNTQNTRKLYMEHANITVKNIDNGVHFFQTAFPEFEVRGGGENDGVAWVHVGTQDTYIALNQRANAQAVVSDYSLLGVNHIGFVVDDVEHIAKRLSAAGYERSYPKQVQQYRIRDYFNDSDGNQYEFVQYLSELPNEKNSYND